MLDLFATGLLHMTEPFNLLLMFFGVSLGILFGAIPGLTSCIAIALCLPLTYTMSSYSAFALLIALFVGGISGGLISAVLINIPGTPASVATTFDGAPLAKKGEASKALGVGIVFSCLGTVFSCIILTFLAPSLAQFALKFSSFEFFSIALFSLSLIGVLSGTNMIKGLLAGAMGLAVSLIGLAPIDGLRRYTFGLTELTTGFSSIPAMVGLFAISEIIKSAMDTSVATVADYKPGKIKGFGFSLKEFFSQIKNFFISAGIGTFIGILPGIGATTSNIMAYAAVKGASKYPEKFGTGVIDGVVASETSNNAVIGGAMVPLISLGIPGDANTAMLLGALMIHGLTPGPALIRNNGDLVYSIFVSILICSFIMLFVEFFGMRIFVQLLRIPKYILLPLVLVLCCVGAISVSGRMFDVYTLIGFGLLGFLLQTYGFPRAPFVLGIILGTDLETNLRQALQLGKNSIVPFFTRPISGLFLCITLAIIASIAWKQIKKRKAGSVVVDQEED